MADSDPTQPPTLVDWGVAKAIGGRIAGDGPATSRADAEAMVAELRADATLATGLVAEFSGLVAPPDTAPVLVVDRRGWVVANADGFAQVMEPLLARSRERLSDVSPGGWTQAIGSRITGAQIGGALGFLSTKVLGQFDPFFDPHGRLLLVAPNVAHVETELDVDPGDFRLWVCLHEETHRVQFTANPWLRSHLHEQVDALATTLGSPEILGDGLKRVVDALRGEGNLLEAISSPAQREIIDRVTGMMSLLEGHADVVMDGVGPSVIPSVHSIRAKFSKRRGGVGILDKLLRRLMGLDAKMAQYRDGAIFVSHVVDTVGMTDFNAVFAGPENLPTKAEIADPGAWIKRVL
ncbi:MAG: zinc-dependent metalloprotease [Nocardioides sp.]